ncbi:MAG: tetratricopeptide repeat protein [Candidatus Marinimicrobia bacterium]|nr:tetratricopeptide repeat protein [Candidatus Neomarinimicrobiota bacterium]
MFCWRGFLVALVTGLLLAGGAAAARADAQSDREFQFAQGLVEMGFPDYAKKVVERVLLRDPEQRGQAQLLEAQIAIQARRFAEAEAILKDQPFSDPKVQAIQVRLANALFLSGEADKAKAIYDRFFKLYEKKLPEDPGLLQLLQESAYHFGQLLERAGDYNGAIRAYEQVMATNPERSALRRLQADTAILMVRQAESLPVGDARNQLLTKAEKLCEDIQWGGMDLAFGQSIPTLARSKVARGQPAEGIKVLESHMDILQQVDDLLKDEPGLMRESPMAAARFMLGELSEQEGKRLLAAGRQEEAVASLGKALREYYNVFARYGESDWGPSAGARAEAVKAQLEGLGKTIRIDLGAQRDQLAATRFRLPDTLFREGSYEQAITEYLKVLEDYPETKLSVGALANLALSYAHTGEPLWAKTVLMYLGERFNQSEQAAMAFLAVGKYYFDAEERDQYLYAYENYVRLFPRHDRVPAILFTLGGMMIQAGQEEQAAPYFEKIIRNYPQSPFYVRALSRKAWDYYQTKDWERAVPAFEALIEGAQPGYDRALAQYCLADSQKQLGNWTDALRAYGDLIGWLRPADSPYNTNRETAEKNADLLEKAVFYLGYCFSRLPASDQQLAQVRQRGIQAFEQFLERYPKSTLAPTAMSAVGGMQLELNDYEAAVKMFDELATRYPDSEEGRNASYSLLRAAIQVRREDVARDAFANMLRLKDNFQLDQFARVGRLLVESEMYAEAIQAFGQVVGATEERSLLERALFGLGTAHHELGQYQESARALDELMTRFPQSGLFYDAKFILAEAYTESEEMDRATAVLSEIFRYADDPVRPNKASYMLAQIQASRGEKEAALGSLLRVALLGDPENPEVRPWIEKSVWESIGLAMEVQRYQDVMDSCDLYEQLFHRNRERVEEAREIKREANRLLAESRAAAGGA